MVCCVSIYACLVASACAASVRSSSSSTNDDDQSTVTISLVHQQIKPSAYADDLSDYAMYPGSNEQMFALHLPLYGGDGGNDNNDEEFSNDISDNASTSDSEPDVPHFADGRHKRFKPNNFIRLGRQPSRLRDSAFMRLGRSGMGVGTTAQRLEREPQPARADNFMRFGRAGAARAASRFLRLGRGEQDEAMQPDSLRFNRRGDSFIRFGKRAELADGGGGASQMVRAMRSNVGAAVLVPGVYQIDENGERNLVAVSATNGHETGPDGLNRIERSDKQFIRLGRRDDAFLRLGKKSMYKTIGANGGHDVDLGLGGSGRVTDVEAVHAKLV